MPITRKMKKAFDLITLEGESKQKALLKAGYSPTVAKTPSLVVERLGWQELLAKHLSQQSLTEQHQALLVNGKEETKVKLLDMGYKLHGVYAPERSVSLNITAKPQEHKELADEYEAKLLASIGQSSLVEAPPSDGGEGEEGRG